MTDRVLHHLCGSLVWLLVHPIRRIPVRTPGSLGLPYRTFRLQSGDAALAAWYIPCDGSRAGLVLCHGLNRNRMQFMPLLPALHEAGFHLLLFDFRAMGLSSGTLCTFGYHEQWDVLAGVRWLREEVGVERVGLHGLSMGGACALLAAARDPGVGAVVTDCAFAHFADLLDCRVLPVPHSLRGFVNRSVRHWTETCYHPLLQVDPEGAVRRWRPRPLLVIHAGADDLVPPEHGYRLARAAGETSDLWIIPNTPHVRGHFTDRSQYQKRVVSFFREHLFSSCRPSST